MNLLAAAFLGLIQGLTEFLPISSSAHIQIAEQVLQLDRNMNRPELTAFIATIQLGTEAAVLIYFFKDILRIAGAWLGGLTSSAKRQNADYRLGWLVIIGSLPVVIVGLLFKDFIENNLRDLWVVVVNLIVFGLALGFADRVGTKRKEIAEITGKDGLLFGLGQALAVVPGVSRSGGTITVGLLLGYTRAAAARYSFLLAIPAVLASGLYEFAKSAPDLSGADMAATLVATIVSFVVGYLVIGGLLKFLNHGSFVPFVIYRVVVGLALALSLVAGWVAPSLA